MKSCPRCLNLAPDDAAACDQCGTVLDPSLLPPGTRAGGTRMETVIESSLRPTPPPLDIRPSTPPPLPSPVPPQNPPGAESPGRRGSTVYMPPQPGPAAGRAAPVAPVQPARKMVAVLVTYSWKPEGQMYPVREGRNLIGRGEECDIRVLEDAAMSQVNSHITFRQKFVLGDMVSMSGTDLNDHPVEEQFRPLGNYARIRTGSTHWIFVILDPPAPPPAS
jgi:type III secretion system (T3SS) inner membrane Yop/YscD-like protein